MTVDLLNERVRILMEAKNHWMERAITAETHAIHIDESECFENAPPVPFRLYRNEDFIVSVIA